MTDLLEKFKSKSPEVVFEWYDEPTGAHGWTVINSLRNGAAGGGTRMRQGLTKDEVVSLAKVMEVKFAVCGPDIGGAKSGINFDPRDPRRDEVLRRWYKAVYPLLKNYYGTGGDLNVDEIKDVIPITESYGLWHPQEGVVNGHFKYIEGDKIKIIGQLRHGCVKEVEDPGYVPIGYQKFAVADMITGFGVAEAVRHFYRLFKKSDLAGKRVIVQGWGNVASAAGYYLSQQGAKIVGIIDREGGIIQPNGLDFQAVKKLFLDKNGNKLQAPNLLSFEETNSKIWDVGAEIFIPGAASKIVAPDQVERMMRQGLEVISCGANVPFTDDGIFFGETAKTTDSKIALIPDFIANCGMARVFAYLMQSNAVLADEAIFSDVSDTIRQALEGIQLTNPDGKNLSARGLDIALRKLLG